MALVDGAHRLVDVNGACLHLLGYRRRQMLERPVYEFILGGPIASEAEWRRSLAKGDFSGEATLVASDGTNVGVQFAAATELVTGQQLVLFVVLSTSRWGRRFRRVASDQPSGEQLSPREREIVGLIAMGNTSPEIADELRIAHETVRTHARNAMTKLGARSRAHLVARVLAEGLLFAGDQSVVPVVTASTRDPGRLKRVRSERAPAQPLRRGGRARGEAA